MVVGGWSICLTARIFSTLRAMVVTLILEGLICRLNLEHAGFFQLQNVLCKIGIYWSPPITNLLTYSYIMQTDLIVAMFVGFVQLSIVRG